MGTGSFSFINFYAMQQDIPDGIDLSIFGMVVVPMQIMVVVVIGQEEIHITAMSVSE